MQGKRGVHCNARRLCLLGERGLIKAALCAAYCPPQVRYIATVKD
jgi:hypothetical protein